MNRANKKEQIEELYSDALYNDLAPNVFADRILKLFGYSGYIPTDEDCKNAIIKQIEGLGFKTNIFTK